MLHCHVLVCHIFPPSWLPSTTWFCSRQYVLSCFSLSNFIDNSICMYKFYCLITNWIFFGATPISKLFNIEVIAAYRHNIWVNYLILKFDDSVISPCMHLRASRSIDMQYMPQLNNKMNWVGPNWQIKEV